MFVDRRWYDLVTKLGGSAQATRSMGKLFSTVAGRFATTGVVADVSCILTSMYLLVCMHSGRWLTMRAALRIPGYLMSAVPV